MAEETEIRGYVDGDEVGITKLVNETFSQPRTPEQWIWKNKENPSGFDSQALAVGDVDGEIISHAGGLPLRMKVNDGLQKGLLTFDFVVRADFRRGLKKMGLFLRTVNKALDHWIVTYDFGHGFPNPEHLRMGERFLKYATAGELPRLTRRLSFRPFAARFIKVRPLLGIVHGLTTILFRLKYRLFAPRGPRQIRVVPTTDFDERADRLWERSSRCFPVALVRDRAFLNWRYRKPGQHYHVWGAYEGGELRGYIAYRTLDYGLLTAGVIMDVLPADDAAVGVALCRAVIEQGLRDGVDFVECWMLEQYPFYEVLKRFGFKTRHSDDVLTFRVLKGKTPTEFFADLKNWYVTLSDTDEL